jgi:hypothetical protein
LTPLFFTTNLVTDELEFHTVLNLDSMEVATRTIGTEIRQKKPMEQATEGPSVTSSILASLVEVCTPADSLVCEDTCVISADSINGEMTIEKVVAVPSTASLLQTITIEDNPLHSTTEVNEEVPWLIEDPSINAASSSMTTSMEEKDLTCPPIHPPTPSATPARRRRKPYDRASLHRSGCIVHRNVLKDLDVVGKDGKLNEGAIQDNVVCLKELLPPDLLKGH